MTHKFWITIRGKYAISPNLGQKQYEVWKIENQTNVALAPINTCSVQEILDLEKKFDIAASPESHSYSKGYTVMLRIAYTPSFSGEVMFLRVRKAVGQDVLQGPEVHDLCRTLYSFFLLLEKTGRKVI